MMKRKRSESPTHCEETVLVQIDQEKDLRHKKEWKPIPQRWWVQMGLYRELWRPTVFIQRKEIAAFLRIFEDDLLKQLLWKDSCYILADKYLLAMVFEYFKRCHFTIEEYNRENFFIALFLANCMEEEDGFSMFEIMSWALGDNWRIKAYNFLRQRDRLWARMDYRAVVTQRSCEEIMELVPARFLWMRTRPKHHGGVVKYDQREHFPSLGPSASPVYCALCYTSRFPEKCPNDNNEEQCDSALQAYHMLW